MDDSRMELATSCPPLRWDGGFQMNGGLLTTFFCKGYKEREHKMSEGIDKKNICWLYVVSTFCAEGEDIFQISNLICGFYVIPNHSSFVSLGDNSRKQDILL